VYIRFVVGSEQEKLNKLHGPITELRLLRDEKTLYDYQVLLANDIFDWFNQKLPCPPFDESGWPDSAISWFKVNDEANIFINKMYDIKAILDEHDIQVRIIRTNDPGMKLYEDQVQVIATAPRGKF